ncbi:methyltransferase domain-containing protein [Aquimarina sp. U1-2]|uniref:methyltransferase domain-containing protein n=1 Tax=Aquimarina sp. U1-2 TaxID=2823141 RepID=UPI001AECD973|nr:methyltransferase domain-containing protein [Aquimarina sp. U1-2]MBP2831913.1 methyltransferase domain-containing protein [Aquimarina sp. U1-2]
MPVNLDHRSNEPELMDNPELEDSALQTALKDLSRVNRMLGGNTITINAVHELIKGRTTGEEITIVDLGCGDGEMLRALAQSFRKKNLHVKLIGVDLNEKSLAYAKKQSTAYPEISYAKLDLLHIQNSSFYCDVIICTLTLHHLSCKEIENVLRKSVTLARTGVIINDLHRSKIAYYLFKIFSLFFITGKIAKYDGLISIKRGFKKEELIQYTQALGLTKYRIDWKWAFRYRWIIDTRCM